jgi:signal transduction histidine kinase
MNGRRTEFADAFAPPAGTGQWSEADERAFSAAVTATNLRRAKFAAIAGMMILVWSAGLSLLIPELSLRDLRGWMLACFVLYAGLLLVRRRVMRARLEVQDAYVFAFTIALIGVCDGFFFILSHQLASVSSFSRGMLVTGVLFLHPPRRFLPVVAVNELLLCAWFGWRGVDAGTMAAFLDGTAGAVVASVASWMLYHARRADFRQQQKIQQQSAEMNELMAITAHDLRSPLLGVKNLLTLGAARPGLERQRLVAVMTDAARACDRLLDLVTGLVDAHAAEQRVVSAAGRVDFRAAIRAAAERAGPAAGAKRVHIECALPEAAVEVTCDEAALRQVLDNLLGNAVKFSPSGGIVRASLAGDGNRWRVEIADEGPGVPEAERGRLFQKYARGSARPTGGEAGSGLGLFIVKTLAERLGASVSHAPRAGGGSVFAIAGERSAGGERNGAER